MLYIANIMHQPPVVKFRPDHVAAENVVPLCALQATVPSAFVVSEPFVIGPDRGRIVMGSGELRIFRMLPVLYNAHLDVPPSYAALSSAYSASDVTVRPRTVGRN